MAEQAIQQHKFQLALLDLVGKEVYVSTSDNSVFTGKFIMAGDDYMQLEMMAIGMRFIPYTAIQHVTVKEKTRE